MEANNFELRIGNYTWSVEFIDKDNEEIKGCDGRTLYNDFRIIIRNDLNYIATKLVIRHEVVHALLSTQGRVFQKKYDIEEVCEFIAYRLNELEQINEQIENKVLMCYLESDKGTKDIRKKRLKESDKNDKKD